MQTARKAVSEVGDNHPIVVNCQRELGHQLPLSSYLLKPVQRYQVAVLIIKRDKEKSDNVVFQTYKVPVITEGSPD